MLEMLQNMPLKRLRLDQARLRSWGSVDDTNTADSSDDEEVGHIEVHWHQFLAVVPNLEVLQLHFQAVKSCNLFLFATMPPKLRLLVLMGILFDEDEDLHDRPATQPLTIQCPFFGDHSGGELEPYSIAARDIHSLWPNAVCKVDAFESWFYGGEPLDRQAEKLEDLNKGLNRCQRGD
ncbi:hypothetical protein RhiJN_21414 [Ceratobasidium sp. AG-Ba]|nr:hypothetical protein RhiJN_21414 [Ceratobasidium sp. AG-Ba]